MIMQEEVNLFAFHPKMRMAMPQTTSDQIDTTGNPLSGGEKRSPFDGQSSEAIIREVNLSRDYAKARRELFDLMERPGLLALVHVQNQNQNPPNPGSLRACVE